MVNSNTNEFTLKVPVLFIGFNRPDVTEKTFEYVKRAKPLNLYVALDGARKDKIGERDQCKEVKKIVQNISWKCETHYKFNETNKGAEITVSSAINWVLQNEEYVIVLEDDIIAPLSFLKFAEEMLILYKDDNRISTVTGSNFTPIPIPHNTDYFFAKYGHSWGWGTWRRAWKGFDLNVEISEENTKKEFLKNVCNNQAEVKYYQKRFKLMRKRGAGNSTWDSISLYRNRIRNSLSIIPRVNLTSNIGVCGLHANGKTEHHFRSYDQNFKVIKHPKGITYFKRYDIYHFSKYINKRKSILKRVFNKIRRILCSK